MKSIALKILSINGSSLMGLRCYRMKTNHVARIVLKVRSIMLLAFVLGLTGICFMVGDHFGDRYERVRTSHISPAPPELSTAHFVTAAK